MRRLQLLMLTAAIGLVPAMDARAQAPMVEQYLMSGKLADGEAALTQHLTGNPKDDQARFGLGALQVIRAVEELMQKMHEYGLRSEQSGIPFLRLPVPDNANPKTMTYQSAGEMVRAWNENLAKAEKTLSQVESKDVKLPLHFGQIRLDFDGDGKSDENETLWRVYKRIRPRMSISDQQASEFVINFDAGDVRWLQGYCHLLMGLSDIVLAYDEKELFDCTAHLFFRKTDQPYPYLQGTRVIDVGIGVDIADAVAFVHLLRCPIHDPSRMTSALGHFQAMIKLSAASWDLIVAETDNDHEWIPNSKQETVIPDVKVTGAMIANWQKFLREMDSLLAGKTLAPFWRGDGKKGVNVRRVFTEPPPLDIVLWVQGTAAAPYLEEGAITDKNTWREIWNAFGEESFFGFAVWFN